MADLVTPALLVLLGLVVLWLLLDPGMERRCSTCGDRYITVPGQLLPMCISCDLDPDMAVGRLLPRQPDGGDR